MKKLIWNSLLVACLVSLLGACGDDDDSAPGSFTYDGKKHSLSKLFVSDEGSYTSGEDIWYERELLFTSSGIKYNTDTEDYTGKGDGLTIYIYAKNDDSLLPVGTYKYVEETAYCEGIYIGYNVDEQTGDSFELDDEAITVTVAKSSSTYTVTVTSSELNLTYKGKATEVAD